MQSGSLSHSQSDVKLDISEEGSNRKLEDSPPPERKRFSILEDLEELNRNLQKHDEEEQRGKKSSYNQDVFRKTLQLTCEYDQTGDKVFRLNLHDRGESSPSAGKFGGAIEPSKEPVAHTPVSIHPIIPVVLQSTQAPPATIANAVPIKKQQSQRYSQSNQTNPITKHRQQSKQTSCQTVIIKNPRLYKTLRTLNLLSPPKPIIPSDFSNELYRKTVPTAPQTEDKENHEYNLFSKAIETERQKDRDTFSSYLKRHK